MWQIYNKASRQSSKQVYKVESLIYVLILIKDNNNKISNKQTTKKFKWNGKRQWRKWKIRMWGTKKKQTKSSI